MVLLLWRDVIVAVRWLRCEGVPARLGSQVKRVRERVEV